MRPEAKISKFPKETFWIVLMIFPCVRPSERDTTGDENDNLCKWCKPWRTEEEEKLSGEISAERAGAPCKETNEREISLDLYL